MDIATFWKMIEAARKTASGDIEKQTELLVEALSKQSDKDIIEFDRIMWDMKGKAYRGNLYDACDFIRCGCSDTDFMDFRAWLIAQGEEIFEKAIENPDSLVEIVDVEHRLDVVYERFAYIGVYAYRRKNGEAAEIPRAPREQPQLIGGVHAEEELPQLFPALMEKLGGCREWWENYI